MRTLAVAWLVACAGDKDTDSAVDADTDADTDTDTDTDTDVDVPDPGTEDHTNCSDAEPNDGPEQAVPCGVVSNALGACYVLSDGHIGDTDTADWFVFATAADVTAFHEFAWWDSGTNLLDLYLYEVVDGAMGPEIWRSEETGTTGENEAFAPVPAEASKTYLLEVRHVTGVGDYGL